MTDLGGPGQLHSSRSERLGGLLSGLTPGEVTATACILFGLFLVFVGLTVALCGARHRYDTKRRYDAVRRHPTYIQMKGF